MDDRRRREPGRKGTLTGIGGETDVVSRKRRARWNQGQRNAPDARAFRQAAQLEYRQAEQDASEDRGAEQFAFVPPSSHDAHVHQASVLRSSQVG